MSIFLNKDNKVIVQGITGSEATVHTARMLKAGTQIVGGVNARKAGTTVTHEDKGGRILELPVFGSVTEAMEKTLEGSRSSWCRSYSVSIALTNSAVSHTSLRL